MSIPAFTYQDFIAWNEPMTWQPGPWVIGHGSERDWAECQSDGYTWCDGWCLRCCVTPPDSMTAYHPSFTANVSINLADYGGATTLDYSWSFWPVYVGTYVTGGTPMQITTSVGDQQYNHNYLATDYATFNATHQWDNAAMFTSNSSITVTKGSDGTQGYIPIQIAFTMTPLTNTQEEWLYIYIKQTTFRITGAVQTPTVGASPTAGSLSSTGSFGSTLNSPATTTPSTSSNLTAQMALQTISPFDTGLLASTSPAPIFQAGPSTSPSSKISVGSLTGAVIGGVGVLILLLFAVFFFRRRRRQQKAMITEPLGAENLGETEQLSSDGEHLFPIPSNDRPARPQIGGYSEKRPNVCLNSTPFPSRPLVTDSTIESSNPHDTSTGTNDLPLTMSPDPVHDMFLRASTLFSDHPYDPPPMYGPEESTRNRPTFSFSPELAFYASQHRDVINESLEARLQAAGYVPTDDPRRLTPEEWRNEYNVTRTELVRLQDLHARTGGGQIRRSSMTYSSST